MSCKKKSVQMDIPWIKIGLFALMFNLALNTGPIGFCLLTTFVIIAWVIEAFINLCILVLTLLGRFCAWIWREYQARKTPTHGGHP